MIKGDGGLVQQCLLWLLNCMFASLSVGLITAVYKSGDKSDMSNYRGITVGFVTAKLFAMTPEQRIASWAEEHAVKAKGQAGFRNSFRTTDNIFILRSLIDKQKETRKQGKCGKLHCCFVDFRKAFDTVPRAVLWQVLAELGVCDRILDIIKSLYAHDSAAVRSSQGIPAIFRCLTGVQQGCPLSATLFGLYVDLLEKHLLETADIDAPDLMGVMVPLLLYADDLILMSKSASGLQKQLDALASFCEQGLSTVNLSKTKVVFARQQSAMCDFRLNGAVVERVDSYRHLGFVFHATKGLHFRKEALMAVASKALFAMRQRCALLGVRDPPLQRKLFDTLVLPILSCGCEFLGVDAKCGAAAEPLHKGFPLGVRKSISTHMVLAELGRLPLQIHFWQRILRYHHRTIALDNVRFVKLAMVDGFVIDQAAVKGCWQHYLGNFLHSYTGEQQLFHQFDLAFIIERAKH